MIPKYDIEYSLVREAEERLASKNAADDTARVAHAALADRYADRAWSAREARYEHGQKADAATSPCPDMPVATLLVCQLAGHPEP